VAEDGMNLLVCLESDENAMEIAQQPVDTVIQ
jgi:hypothetical protein